MEQALEWEEKVETTRRMSLLAVHGSIGHGGATRPATLDDLRKACEAVGLLVGGKDELSRAIRNRDAAYKQLGDMMNRAWDAERMASQALAVGLAECERLRGEVNDAEACARQADIEVTRRDEVILKAQNILQDIEGDEGLLDTARRTKDAIAAVCGQRDAAIARAEKAEAERDAFGAKNVEFHRAYGEEQARSREIIASLESRLAAVDLANGHANEAEARAEKAEARVMDADADSESYVTDLHAAKDRIAELETALANAANGVGFGEAGPAVYAANARHDEAAREWEDERAVLVRTRQETQDKLSEARRELHELRGALSTAVRIGKPLSFSGPDSSPRFSITEDEAATRDADSRDAALIRAKTDASLRPIEAAIESARLRADALLGTRDLPRATARDVEAMADEAYRNRLSMDPTLGDMRALADRVADRVRREQCLVTRAVEMGVGVRIRESGAHSWVEWDVIVDDDVQSCAPSDVARVLAEMLGEVGR
jgi:hypothetical protein